MSRESTALITIGPRNIAPWGDRVWRVAGTAQLVEGSTPYWIVTPTEPAQYSVSSNSVGIHLPEPESLFESILMFLAAYFGDEDVEACLVETHNVTKSANGREIAPYFELADEVQSYLVGRLSQCLRIAVTRLSDQTLMDRHVCALLRDAGFDVEEYSLVS